MAEGFLNTLVEYMIAAAAGGGIVFILLKKYALEWLEAKFQKQIEEYKHDLANIFDRSRRVHEKEFEVLGETWRRITISHRLCKIAMSIVREYPDVKTMDDDEITDHLREVVPNIADKEISSVLALSGEARQNRFNLVLNFFQFRKAAGDFQKTYDYIEENKIFYEKKIFDSVNSLMRDFRSDILTYDTYDYMIRHDEGFSTGAGQEKMKAARSILAEYDEKFTEISSMIQSRLRVNETT